MAGAGEGAWLSDAIRPGGGATARSWRRLGGDRRRFGMDGHVRPGKNCLDRLLDALGQRVRGAQRLFAIHGDVQINKVVWPEWRTRTA